MGYRYGGWAPYVPVAKRRANGLKEAKKLQKKGQKLEPIELTGKVIASSFWGNAWCKNLERYSDLANRIPRGRTYVRNGSVLHLEIQPGVVNALVSGSRLYKVKVEISALASNRWKELKESCSGSIGSLVELLQGKFSKEVMERVTSKDQGLFPAPREISMKCSCPDYADMCKHVAAVLYGVGARLDLQPELLFKLRQVDHSELIELATIDLGQGLVSASANVIDQTMTDLDGLFGIELAPEPEVTKAKPKSARAATAKKKNSKKTASTGRAGKGRVGKGRASKGTSSKNITSKKARPVLKGRVKKK
jgi:uncharacterized Zn finger protein